MLSRIKFNIINPDNPDSPDNSDRTLSLSSSSSFSLSQVEELKGRLETLTETHAAFTAQHDGCADTKTRYTEVKREFNALESKHKSLLSDRDQLQSELTQELYQNQTLGHAHTHHT